MPAYDYRCMECSSRFELRQKMSDPPVGICPGCGGRVERLIGGGAGVISKGGASQSAGYSDSPAACGLDGPCCGQGGGCGDGMCCEN